MLPLLKFKVMFLFISSTASQALRGWSIREEPELHGAAALCLQQGFLSKAGAAGWLGRAGSTGNVQELLGQQGGCSLSSPTYGIFLCHPQKSPAAAGDACPPCSVGENGLESKNIPKYPLSTLPVG